MTRLRIFLAPLALLLIGAAAKPESSDASGGAGDVGAGLSAISSMPPPRANWRQPVWRQVRIEQHFSIRISPGTATMPAWVIEELEQESRVEGGEDRRIGKCLVISSIAALRPGDGDELLLFLNDDRIIGATLEKRCNARDFYSGFYVERNADGAICAGRDTLQSRSGTNCKVRRLHELVPTASRRFP